jgi:sialidase-1
MLVMGLAHPVYAAELSDGSVLLNMRSYRGKQCRALATSRDGGLTWTAIRDEPALIESVCQASIISFPDKNGQRALAFSNPASTRREKMTLQISRNEGKTWGDPTLIYGGPAAYSCLAVLPDGSIGCLFERDNYARISLARVPWQE